MAQTINDFARLCQQYPKYFMTEVLGVDPWAMQGEIANAITKYREVAVKSCHGIGKDWISARITIWFLMTHDPAMVITTGPTDRQVKHILWKEIEHAIMNANIPLGGELYKQRYELSPNRWAMGYTAGDDATRFQGFHCENLLIIIDEAAGVSRETFSAIDSLMTSENVHYLAIGNPTDPTSEFAKLFKTPGIHKISINAFETPNLVHFGITQDDMRNNTWRQKITGPLPRPQLVTPEWVATRYARWGESNPFYQSRVMAQFPDEGDDTLIPMAHIEQAVQRTLEPTAPRVMACDIARYGDDSNVIMLREGEVLRQIDQWSKTDTMATSGRIKRLQEKQRPESTMVDIIGIGAGVYDRLCEQKANVSPFNAALSARDNSAYANARAESYWLLRCAFENGEIDISENDEDLQAQLSDIHWKADSRGRVVIEPKEDIKKRTHKSPDSADAAAMCYAPLAAKAPSFFSVPRERRVFSEERPRF